MTVTSRIGGEQPHGPVTLELDEIQATVLRYRPEPYYGTHVMLRVDDARAGRQLLRDLAPHVDSAAEWWQASEPSCTRSGERYSSIGSGSERGASPCRRSIRISRRDRPARSASS